MIQDFKKGNIIRSFKVENNKVFTTITLGEYNITNPTLELFLSVGWEIYTPEPPEPEPEGGRGMSASLKLKFNSRRY